MQSPAKWKNNEPCVPSRDWAIHGPAQSGSHFAKFPASCRVHLSERLCVRGIRSDRKDGPCKAITVQPPESSKTTCNPNADKTAADKGIIEFANERDEIRNQIQ